MTDRITTSLSYTGLPSRRNEEKLLDIQDNIKYHETLRDDLIRAIKSYKSEIKKIEAKYHRILNDTRKAEKKNKRLINANEELEKERQAMIDSILKVVVYSHKKEVEELDERINVLNLSELV